MANRNEFTLEKYDWKHKANANDQYTSLLYYFNGRFQTISNGINDVLANLSSYHAWMISIHMFYLYSIYIYSCAQKIIAVSIW